jgi:hypothetical protein
MLFQNRALQVHVRSWIVALRELNNYLNKITGTKAADRFAQRLQIDVNPSSEPQIESRSMEATKRVNTWNEVPRIDVE